MIYIIKHKECETNPIRGYKDLGVGKLFEGRKYNINYLNPFINEMTGIYDIWKNCKEEIKGQIQYRKHLSENGKDVLTYDRIKRILQDYDIIATKPYIDGNGIYKGLRNEIGDKQVQHTLDKYYNELIKIEPDLESYFKLKSFHYGNMFICKREIYNAYCEWVFPIIIPLTEQFVREDRHIHKDRLMGYIGERLFTYWVILNNLTVKEMDCVVTGERV